jgi:hypothetical protein
MLALILRPINLPRHIHTVELEWIHDVNQRHGQMQQLKAHTNLEGPEPWHRHQNAGGSNLGSILPRRVRTGQNKNMRVCGSQKHLDEPPDEAVDPDPPGHELVVPEGQAHHRQPAQLSPGPEAEGESRCDAVGPTEPGET